MTLRFAGRYSTPLVDLLPVADVEQVDAPFAHVEFVEDTVIAYPQLELARPTKRM